MGTSPNTYSLRTVWNAMYQITHYKEAVYTVIAEESLSKDVRPGITVKRSYASNIYSQNMGDDGSYSPQAFTDTDESLTIDQRKEASVTIEELKKIQTHLPTQRKYGEKSMNALFQQIDADVLSSAVTGANSIMDDGFLGGTSGNGIAASAANIANIFTGADTVLRLNNVRYNTQAKFTGKVKLDSRNRMGVAIITPYVNQALTLYLGSKTSKMGDEVSIKGYANFFANFNVFVSNNLPWSGEMVLATNPTDGDTITINGVTLTAKGTVDAGVTAGQFKIASTAAKTVTNLKAFLNAPTTTVADATDAGYNALSAANASLLQNLTATQINPVSAAGTTLKIVMAGYGNVIVSQVMTAAANLWTAAKQQSHCIFGVNNSISLAMQKEPNLYINPVSRKVAKDYVTWTSYGMKVFNDQKYQLIDVPIDSHSFLTAPTNVTY